MNEILRRAGELEDRREPYALATVVAVDRPVSARLGDRAIIDPTGRVEGWVGGSCSEPIVIREALASFTDGNPRLVRIRPPEAPHEPVRPGVVTEVTTCASEGGLDVFVEPRLPRPQLVVVGSSPVARTLAKLAELLGHRFTSVVEEPSESASGVNSATGVEQLGRIGLGAQDAVVVATMNRYDEVALEAALETQAGYIGLVASRTRAANVFAMLKARGLDEKSLHRVNSPAGLDLGPSTQEEIALAVMAEVVAEGRRRKGAIDALCAPETVASEAVDPVCGMKVAITPGAISASHQGTTYYFCNPGCKREFLEQPETYLQVS